MFMCLCACGDILACRDYVYTCVCACVCVCVWVCVRGACVCVDLILEPIAQSASHERPRGNAQQVDAEDQDSDYCGAHGNRDKVLHGRKE